MAQCDTAIASKDEELSAIRSEKDARNASLQTVRQSSPFLLEGERIFSLLRGEDLLRVYGINDISQHYHISLSIMIMIMIMINYTCNVLNAVMHG